MKRCSQCSRNAASPRVKFCTVCFKKKAAAASLRRKVYGGGGGVRGNKGSSKRKVDRGGGGVFGNKGNTTTGPPKSRAGRRSALRRCTNIVLVVKNPWLDLILSGRKTWEIHLALSGAGGRIFGQCQLTESFPIDHGDLAKHVDKHCINDTDIITYSRPHVWVMSKPQRYENPFAYSHPYGAVKWVKLR